MRGSKVHYIEVRSKGVAADDRQIDMDGDDVSYTETNGVESIKEQAVEVQTAETEVQKVNTEVQKVETEVQKVETEAQTAETKVQKVNIEVLTTEQAMVYWRRLMAAGFVDENCQLRPDTSRRQACDIADMFARKMGEEATKWKLFETYWGKKHLAQYKLRSQDNGKLPARHNEIDRLFKDDA